MTFMEMRVWFLQSNPAHYDIDTALSVLDRIWWRVPQYTNEIHTDDVAVLWRSGKNAGIVGIGRIIADPQQHPADAAEEPFVLTEEEGAEDATRALIRVQAVHFIAKDKVRATRRLPSASDCGRTDGDCVSDLRKRVGTIGRIAAAPTRSRRRSAKRPAARIRLAATR